MSARPSVVGYEHGACTAAGGGQADEERAPVTAHAEIDVRPRLVFFTASTSGPCRKTEGWIAQVLQHRRNHRKIRLVTVDVGLRPELKERFHVQNLPTLVLIEEQTAKARLECPRGVKDITAMLAPWLV